ncbi:MAG: prephenate dehydrogenase dimerization domain-containing protein, partial [Kiritimatiellia bacterium]
KAGCGTDVDAIMPFCGGGIRDTTRIAAGSENVWHDIVKTNADCLSRELERYANAVADLRDMIAREDFEGVRAFLAECRQLRRKMGQSHEHGPK